MSTNVKELKAAWDGTAARKKKILPSSSTASTSKDTSTGSSDSSPSSKGKSKSLMSKITNIFSSSDSGDVDDGSVDDTGSIGDSSTKTTSKTKSSSSSTTSSKGTSGSSSTSSPKKKGFFSSLFGDDDSEEKTTSTKSTSTSTLSSSTTTTPSTTTSSSTNKSSLASTATASSGSTTSEPTSLVGKAKNVQEKVGTFFGSSWSAATEKLDGYTVAGVKGGTLLGKVFKVIIIIAVVFALMWIVNQYFFTTVDDKMLFNGVKQGKTPLVIPHKELPTLVNMNEMTIHTWIYIRGLDYKFGELKPIFVKGDVSGIPLQSINQQCPGLYLEPKTNALRLKLATSKPNEPLATKEIVIDDVPMQRWFHFGCVIRSSEVEIYMNGELTITKTLDRPPVFNEGPVTLTFNGGFDGVLVGTRYLPRLAAAQEVMTYYVRGPATISWWKRLWVYLVRFFTFGHIFGDLFSDMPDDKETAVINEKKDPAADDAQCKK